MRSVGTYCWPAVVRWPNVVRDCSSQPLRSPILYLKTYVSSYVNARAGALREQRGGAASGATTGAPTCAASRHPKLLRLDPRIYSYVLELWRLMWRPAVRDWWSRGSRSAKGLTEQLRSEGKLSLTWIWLCQLLSPAVSAMVPCPAGCRCVQNFGRGTEVAMKMRMKKNRFHRSEHVADTMLTQGSVNATYE